VAPWKFLIDVVIVDMGSGFESRRHIDGDKLPRGYNGWCGHLHQQGRITTISGTLPKSDNLIVRHEQIDRLIE
jgi:hypothetical protein